MQLLKYGFKSSLKLEIKICHTVLVAKRNGVFSDLFVCASSKKNQK